MNLKRHFEKYHNTDYELIKRKNNDNIHLIINYYSLNDRNNFICKECSKEYKIILLDTLKKHYARCHKDIWMKIKKRF